MSMSLIKNVLISDNISLVVHSTWKDFLLECVLLENAFIAVTLLVGHQAGHPACYEPLMQIFKGLKTFW